MKQILIIDDERVFPSLEEGNEVRYARTSDEAIEVLSDTVNGFSPKLDEVWFDHDLGGEDDATRVTAFMDEVDFFSRGIWPDHIKRAFVHSMNPTGANRLRGIVSGYGIPTRRVSLPSGHGVIGIQHTYYCHECVRLIAALQRIADMPIDPRPDGTHNYDRAAIIEIAREALNHD